MEKEMIDKELIENAIAEALKTGGDFAEIFFEDKRSSSAYFDNGKSIFRSISSFWQSLGAIRSIFDHFEAIFIF